MDSLVARVRGFRGRRVLCVGDAMLDTYLEGDAARLCREGPVPVVHKQAEEHNPGGAANSAANLAALGADVAFLGLTGQDSAAATLRRTLRAAGVDHTWLVGDANLVTLQKMRILANGQYVVRFDAGEAMEPTPDVRQTLRSHLRSLYPTCDLVLIADYGYGVVDANLLADLRSLHALRPVPIVVDGKDLHRYRDFPATVVTPNLAEAALATGTALGPDTRLAMPVIEEVGHRVLDMLAVQCVAVTLAGDGVLLLDRRHPPCHLPARPVPAVHDVGAGDSFTAALGLALAAGAGPREAVRLGIAAAGIAVTRPRTAVVTQSELLQRLSLDEGNAPDSLLDLATLLDIHRQAGRSIVFTNGVFDILHAGHVHFLREARKLGDVLVVAVNSDRGARRLKGHNRPINGERDRLALVAELDSVDHALLFDEDDPSALIRALRPNVHVKGGDYAQQSLPEAEAVRAVGGRTIILPLMGDVSTSTVIERIITLAGQEVSA